jgi:hypothetical protein
MTKHELNGVLVPEVNGTSNAPKGPISTYPKSRISLEDRFIDEPRTLRVAVIGAGLAGVTAGILLPAKVPSIDLVIYEKNEDVVRNPLSLTVLLRYINLAYREEHGSKMSIPA